MAPLVLVQTRKFGALDVPRKPKPAPKPAPKLDEDEDLNAKSFQMGMESLNYEDVVSGNTVSYSATDHQGADEVVVSVIKDGNWMELARQ